MRIKVGDQVAVLAGKDRGKRGKVLRMFPKDDRALVERLISPSILIGPRKPTKPAVSLSARCRCRSPD
jgi:large subunit ribosomal protein L24